MAALVSALATAAGWAYYAVINPTVGGAIVAGVFSVVNTAILLRHERRVDARFAERRNVFVRGTPDDPEAVLVTSEERRELEDRRAQPKPRTARERRRGRRRRGSSDGP